jgi:hypothetical protein
MARRSVLPKDLGLCQTGKKRLVQRSLRDFLSSEGGAARDEGQSGWNEAEDASPAWWIRRSSNHHA